MSAPFAVAQCRACGHTVYPPRIVCSRCGSTEWGRTLAETGVVKEITVRRPVLKRRQLPWGDWLDQAETRLATVQTDAGPLIVARVGEEVSRGDRVRLVARASTAIAVPGQVVEAGAEPVDG